jgi:hypothetical protein
MNPRVLETSGFKHLDRVVRLVSLRSAMIYKYLAKTTWYADEGIYTILDMHALPSG